MKIYKTDIGTKISIVLVSVLVLVLIYCELFWLKQNNFKSIISIVFTVSFLVGVWLSFFSLRAIITDETLEVRMLFKKRSIRWEDISEVSSFAFILIEGTVLRIKDKSGKYILSIPINLGVEMSFLPEFMKHLPKNVALNLESYVHRYIVKATQRRERQEVR